MGDTVHVHDHGRVRMSCWEKSPAAKRLLVLFLLVDGVGLLLRFHCIHDSWDHGTRKMLTSYSSKEGGERC